MLAVDESNGEPRQLLSATALHRVRSTVADAVSPSSPPPPPLPPSPLGRAAAHTERAEGYHGLYQLSRRMAEDASGPFAAVAASASLFVSPTPLS